jgi:hypothetical protein
MYYGTCEHCNVGHYRRIGSVIECQHCGDHLADIGKCPECGREDCILVSDVCCRCNDAHYLVRLLEGNLRVAG